MALTVGVQGVKLPQGTRGSAGGRTRIRSPALPCALYGRIPEEAVAISEAPIAVGQESDPLRYPASPAVESSRGVYFT